MRLILLLLYTLLAGVVHGASVTDGIRLPPGFQIEVVVDGVPDARSMALGERGDPVHPYAS